MYIQTIITSVLILITLYFQQNRKHYVPISLVQPEQTTRETQPNKSEPQSESTQSKPKPEPKKPEPKKPEPKKPEPEKPEPSIENKDSEVCEVLCKDGVRSKKTWDRWRIKNHPDKTQSTDTDEERKFKLERMQSANACMDTLDKNPSKLNDMCPVPEHVPTTPEPPHVNRSTPEPIVPEPVSTPEPIVPEPIVPEPVSTPEPIILEPVVPEPIILEPVVPEPIVPEPIVPEPIVLEPIVPEPGQPEDAEARAIRSGLIPTLQQGGDEPETTDDILSLIVAHLSSKINGFDENLFIYNSKEEKVTFRLIISDVLDILKKDFEKGTLIEHHEEHFYKNILPQIYAIILLNSRNLTSDANTALDDYQVQFDQSTLQKMILRNKSHIIINRIFREMLSFLKEEVKKESTSEYFTPPKFKELFLTKVYPNSNHSVFTSSYVTNAEKTVNRVKSMLVEIQPEQYDHYDSYVSIEKLYKDLVFQKKTITNIQSKINFPVKEYVQLDALVDSISALGKLQVSKTTKLNIAILESTLAKYKFRMTNSLIYTTNLYLKALHKKKGVIFLRVVRKSKEVKKLETLEKRNNDNLDELKKGLPIFEKEKDDWIANLKSYNASVSEIGIVETKIMKDVITYVNIEYDGLSYDEIETSLMQMNNEYVRVVAVITTELKTLKSKEPSKKIKKVANRHLLERTLMISEVNRADYNINVTSYIHTLEDAYLNRLNETKSEINDSLNSNDLPVYERDHFKDQLTRTNNIILHYTESAITFKKSIPRLKAIHKEHKNALIEYSKLIGNKMEKIEPDYQIPKPSQSELRRMSYDQLYDKLTSIYEKMEKDKTTYTKEIERLNQTLEREDPEYKKYVNLKSEIQNNTTEIVSILIKNCEVLLIELNVVTPVTEKDTADDMSDMASHVTEKVFESVLDGGGIVDKSVHDTDRAMLISITFMIHMISVLIIPILLKYGIVFSKRSETFVIVLIYNLLCFVFLWLMNTESIDLMYIVLYLLVFDITYIALNTHHTKDEYEEGTHNKTAYKTNLTITWIIVSICSIFF